MKFIFLKNKANRDLFILLLAIILGSIIGFYFPNFMSSIAWVGKIFMNYLMLLVLPLIFFALVSAITSMGDIKKLGNMGKYSIITIFLNVAMAAAIGLIFALFFKPGEGVNSELLINETNKQLSNTQASLTFTDFISGIFPPNLGEVAIKSQILPIVFFSVFFAIIAIKNINKNTVQIVISACIGFKDILLEMIGFVMKITPIAMFSLIGNAVSSSILKGHFYEDLMGILKFIIIFLAGCALLCMIQFFILYILMGKKSFLFLSQSIKSSTTGFATSSSMATLPVMLLNAHESQIDDTVAKFTLPLTVVFNLGSSALYVACATVFVSQVLHADISGWNIIIIYFTTVLTGLGTTGIPNAGFIATMTVLRTISLPTSAVAILFPIDAVLSRVRTAVNIWGHLVCTKCVDIWIQKKNKGNSNEAQ